MAENTKYEILLNELSSMETQVLVLTNKWKDTYNRNRELEEQFAKYKRENLDLNQKISVIEKELEARKTGTIENEANLLNSLNPKERESLKVKLQNMISRIDFHLSSERQT